MHSQQMVQRVYSKDGRLLQATSDKLLASVVVLLLPSSSKLSPVERSRNGRRVGHEQFVVAGKTAPSTEFGYCLSYLPAAHSEQEAHHIGLLLLLELFDILEGTHRDYFSAASAKERTTRYRPSMGSDQREATRIAAERGRGRGHQPACVVRFPCRGLVGVLSVVVEGRKFEDLANSQPVMKIEGRFVGLAVG